jgi:mannitol-specific phosphotransferase system IIBC component
VATTFVNGLNKVYLPFIIKPPPTELSVFNDKTGGNVIFTVIGTGVSCTVPNNTTLFCGSFPPGTYTVQVTAACGSATTSKFYESGPQTTKVFCK